MEKETMKHSFQEVIHQMHRMCSAGRCNECPLYNKCFAAIGVMSLTNTVASEIETTVMAWAAENPEPVYPIWRDYLEALYDSKNTTEIWYSHIPADIAERLGIEPKEDGNG